jgi:2-polyprenyl-6-methoxyphenol hydroxylase-like FAD-dependent oxidoreductase
MRNEDNRPGRPADLDADVIIVGYGPVGQTLAALLGQSGHRVVVCERRSGRYETPRAGHFDHEIMRVFQQLGVAEEVLRVADPARLYEFLDPDGSVVSRLPRDWAAPSGWDASYHFYQPELEEVLDEAVRRQASVEVRFESNVVGIRQESDDVVVELEDGGTLSARYVIGADGANSGIRTLSGIGTQDLGFQADWLVVDVKPLPGAAHIDIPDTGQVLDPARPSHMGRVSQRYFRWEFMLVEGDDPREITEPDRIWQLLAPWIDPSQGTLIRQTVYTFRSIVADTFRDGSVLLAGDAAHLMPPFLGQGMCSGIRDAATLGWMLDLVLRGSARDELLDDYTAARRSHVLAYIEESVRIGTVVCETDPVLAAQRRATLMASTEIPPPFEPSIGAGFRAGDPLAGALAVQPVLEARDGATGLSDDVLGAGFTLLSVAEPNPETAASIADLQHEIDLRVGILGSGGLSEVGDALVDWLTGGGVVAAVVRPDFYVFGTAATTQDVPGLLADLRASLSLV